MPKNHVQFKCGCGAVHHIKVVDDELKHEVEYPRKKKQVDNDDAAKGTEKGKGKNNSNLVADFIQGTGIFADNLEVEDSDNDTESNGEEDEEND